MKMLATPEQGLVMNNWSSVKGPAERLSVAKQDRATSPLYIPHLLAAFCTHVRALSSVCTHVYLQVVFLCEMFATLSTAEGSFP
jgi:hypothetical protein